MKHLQQVMESTVRAIDLKSQKIVIQQEILDNRMKLAEQKAAETIHEKVTAGQKFGKERVEEAKERRDNFVYANNDDLKRAIDLSLIEMKQEKAKTHRESNIQ